jgi:hypothetical protein
MEDNDGNHVKPLSSITNGRVPTYIITALYLGPAALWIYWRYGRGENPPKPPSEIGETKLEDSYNLHTHSHEMQPHEMQSHEMHNHSDHVAHSGGHMHMHGGPGVPFYISVLIGTTHCGAGCVLGDIVGEWLVYGTGVTINDKSFWPELLIGTSSLTYTN